MKEQGEEKLERWLAQGRVIPLQLQLDVPEHLVANVPRGK